MNKIRQTGSEGNIVEPNGSKVSPGQGRPKEPSLHDNMQAREISYMLGMEKKSEIKKYHDELDVLVEWAKDKAGDKSDKIEELKWAVRQLQDKLGSPHMGEKQITQLSRFARLSMDSKDIERKMRKMMGIDYATE